MENSFLFSKPGTNREKHTRADGWLQRVIIILYIIVPSGFSKRPDLTVKSTWRFPFVVIRAVFALVDS